MTDKPPTKPLRTRSAVRRVLFRLAAPIERFLRTEAASGTLLMVAAAVALVWANSRFAHGYHLMADLPLGVRAGRLVTLWPLHRWINDLFMTLFFLVAGMEIRRELSTGELRTPARAALPLVAALGGMIAPAGVYLLLARSGVNARGWGIPMATDIAFSLGVIAFVKRRVPPSLLVFLTALAIFDDLGAIVVIAVFYGGHIALAPLLVALALTAGLVRLSQRRAQSIVPYALLGVALWVELLRAGLHPTLAGVVVGVCLPPTPAATPDAVLDDLEAALVQLRARGVVGRDVLGAIERHLEAMQSPLDRMMHGLHGVVAFVIVPAFALVNAGVAVNLRAVGAAPITLAVALGLSLGKPLGITLATFVAVRSGLSPMPANARWRDVLGVAMIAGVGFTMSLFVDELAFRGLPAASDEARVGVMLGSFTSALAGIAWLRVVGRPQPEEPDVEDLPVYARSEGDGEIPSDA
jgi:Na+:H+ antiporter, NhaA family